MAKCKRCGTSVAEGSYHEPYAATWADKAEKKYRKGACDIFQKGDGLLSGMASR